MMIKAELLNVYRVPGKFYVYFMLTFTCVYVPVHFCHLRAGPVEGTIFPGAGVAGHYKPAWCEY